MLSQKQSNDILNYLFLFYAFSIPLSRAGVVLATLLIFIFWLIEGDFKNKLHTIFKEKFFIALFAYIGLLLLSLLWVESHNVTNGLEYMRKFLYILPIVVIYTSIKNEYINRVIYSFLIAMGISVIASVGIILGLYEGKTAISFFIGNHIMYSFFLSFSLLMLLILLRSEGQSKIRLLYTLLFVVFLVVLFFSQARTGQLLFFIGLFALLFVIIQHKIKALMLFALTSTLIFIMAYNLNDRFKKRIDFIASDLSHISQGDTCNSLGGRLFTWQVALDIAKEHPLLGMGISDHTQYLKEAMERDEVFKKCKVLKDMIDYFHSQYIEVSAAIGLIGLLLFGSIFYFLSKVPIEHPTLQLIKAIVIILFLTLFIADVPFRKQLGLALFALFSGVVMAKYKMEQKRENSK